MSTSQSHHEVPNDRELTSRDTTSTSMDMQPSHISDNMSLDPLKNSSSKNSSGENPLVRDKSSIENQIRLNLEQQQQNFLRQQTLIKRLKESSNLNFSDGTSHLTSLNADCSNHLDSSRLTDAVIAETQKLQVESIKNEFEVVQSLKEQLNSMKAMENQIESQRIFIVHLEGENAELKSKVNCQERLRSQCLILEERFKLKDDELDRKQNEIDHLIKKIEQQHRHFTEEYQRLNKINEERWLHLNTKLEDSVKENVELKNIVEKTTKEKTQFEYELNVAVEDERKKKQSALVHVQNLEKKIEEQKQTIEEGKEKEKINMKDRNDMKCKLDQKTLEIKNKEDKLQLLLTNNEEINKELNNERRKVDLKEKMIHQLQSQLESAQQHMIQEKNKLVEEAKQNHIQVSSTMSQLHQDNLQLSSTISKVSSTASQLREDKAQLASEVSQLSSTVSQLQEEKNQLTSTVSQISSTHSQLQEDKIQLISKVTKLTSTVSQLQNEKMELSKTSSLLSNTVSQLQDENNQLSATVFQFHHEKNQLQEENSQLHQHNCQVEEDNRQLQENLISQEKQIILLEQKTLYHENDFSKKQTIIEELKKQLGEKIDSLNDVQEASSKLLIEMSHEITSIVNEIYDEKPMTERLNETLKERSSIYKKNSFMDQTSSSTTLRAMVRNLHQTVRYLLNEIKTNTELNNRLAMKNNCYEIQIQELGRHIDTRNKEHEKLKKALKNEEVSKQRAIEDKEEIINELQKTNTFVIEENQTKENFIFQQLERIQSYNKENPTLNDKTLHDNYDSLTTQFTESLSDFLLSYDLLKRQIMKYQEKQKTMERKFKEQLDTHKIKSQEKQKYMEKKWKEQLEKQNLNDQNNERVMEKKLKEQFEKQNLKEQLKLKEMEKLIEALETQRGEQKKKDQAKVTEMERKFNEMVVQQEELNSQCRTMRDISMKDKEDLAAVYSNKISMLTKQLEEMENKCTCAIQDRDDVVVKMDSLVTENQDMKLIVEFMARAIYPLLAQIKDLCSQKSFLTFRLHALEYIHSEINEMLHILQEDYSKNTLSKRRSIKFRSIVLSVLAANRLLFSSSSRKKSIHGISHSLTAKRKLYLLHPDLVSENFLSKIKEISQSLLKYQENPSHGERSSTHSKTSPLGNIYLKLLNSINPILYEEINPSFSTCLVFGWLGRNRNRCSSLKSSSGAKIIQSTILKFAKRVEAAESQKNITLQKNAQLSQCVQKLEGIIAQMNVKVENSHYMEARLEESVVEMQKSMSSMVSSERLDGMMQKVISLEEEKLRREEDIKNKTAKNIKLIESLNHDKKKLNEKIKLGEQYTNQLKEEIAKTTQILDHTLEELESHKISMKRQQIEITDLQAQSRVHLGLGKNLNDSKEQILLLKKKVNFLDTITEELKEENFKLKEDLEKRTKIDQIRSLQEKNVGNEIKENMLQWEEYVDTVKNTNLKEKDKNTTINKLQKDCYYHQETNSDEESERYMEDKDKEMTKKHKIGTCHQKQVRNIHQEERNIHQEEINNKMEQDHPTSYESTSKYLHQMNSKHQMDSKLTSYYGIPYSKRQIRKL